MEYRDFELIDSRELHYEHGAVANLIYTLWTKISGDSNTMFILLN